MTELAMPSKIQTMMPTTMTQTMTIPVFFRVSARVGQATFFSSAFSSRKNRPTRLEKAGLFVLVGLGLGLFRLGGFGLFRLLLRPVLVHLFFFRHSVPPFFLTGNVGHHHLVSL